MERKSLVEIQGLRRGIGSLEMIARIAPLMGAFESVREMLWWLSALPFWCRGGHSAGGMGDAMIPLMLSLPVAIFAYAVFALLRRWALSLEVQIQTGVLGTLSVLRHMSAR